MIEFGVIFVMFVMTWIILVCLNENIVRLRSELLKDKDENDWHDPPSPPANGVSTSRFPRLAAIVALVCGLGWSAAQATPIPEARVSEPKNQCCCADCAKKPYCDCGCRCWSAISPRTPLERIQDAMIRAELMDESGRKYLFARAKDLWIDLGCIQRTRAEFADVPFVADAKRFPSAELSRQAVSLGYSYLSWLESKRSGFAATHDQEIAPVIQETRIIVAIWEACWQATCEDYGVVNQRRGLACLQAMLGPANYAAARMPPPVPLWRFQECDP